MNCHEYDCPKCFEPIEVPDTETEAVHCKNCDCNIQVNRDGELIDEAWHDLTTLNIPLALDCHVIASMIKHGGSFTKALGVAARNADPSNLKLIKFTWPNYWRHYSELFDSIGL